MIEGPLEGQVQCLSRARTATSERLAREGEAKRALEAAVAELVANQALTRGDVARSRAMVDSCLQDGIAVHPRLNSRAAEDVVDPGISGTVEMGEAVLEANRAVGRLEALTHRLSALENRSRYVVALVVSVVATAGLGLLLLYLLGATSNLGVQDPSLVAVLMIALLGAVYGLAITTFSFRAKLRRVETLCQLHETACDASDAAEALSAVRAAYAIEPTLTAMRALERRRLIASGGDIFKGLERSRRVLDLPAWRVLLEHEASETPGSQGATGVIEQILTEIQARLSPEDAAEAFYQRATILKQHRCFIAAHNNYQKAHFIQPGYRDAEALAQRMFTDARDDQP